MCSGGCRAKPRKLTHQVIGMDETDLTSAHIQKRQGYGTAGDQAPLSASRDRMKDLKKTKNPHTKAQTAILFDAENISFRHVEEVMTASYEYGKPILRAYADFSRPQARGWERPALNYGIRTIHQFSYDGKNSSSDFLMMHDAFKLMHSGKIDTFVIVTCDRDFVTPIQLLRQSGAYVHGMGVYGRVSDILQDACNCYSLLAEQLTDSAGPARTEPEGGPAQIDTTERLLNTYEQLGGRQNEWVPLSTLRQRSGIAPERFKKFSVLLRNTGCFELSSDNTLARLEPNTLTEA